MAAGASQGGASSLEWTTVTGRKASRRRSAHHGDSPAVAASSERGGKRLGRDAAEEAVRKACAAVAAKGFAARLAGLAEGWDVTRVVVLGLGPPCASAASRAQLGLVEAVRAALPEHTPCEAYDPAFGDDDAALLEARGVVVTRDAAAAEEALRVGDASDPGAAGSELFLMPHCEGTLYDALLRRSWELSRLRRLKVVGNSFAAYERRWELAPGGRNGSVERPGHVLAVAPLVRETPLGADADAFPVLGAFTDTALLEFDALQELPTVVTAM